MVMENMFGVEEIGMKVNGKLVSDMDKVEMNLKMETAMLESIPGVKLKDMVFIHGAMDQFIVDNSLMERRTVKVTGERFKETIIVINILESTKTTKSMAMENLAGSQAQNSKETILTTKNMAMVKCSGKTVAYTKDFGMKVSKMVSEL